MKNVTKPLSDEHIAAVKRLWKDGASGAEIAAKMGVTRNSVMGLVNRRRIKEGSEAWPVRAKSPLDAAEIAARTKKAVKKKAEPKVGKKPSRPKASRFTLSTLKNPGKRPKPKPVRKIAPVTPLARFMDRRDNQCAWIDEDPKKLFAEDIMVCGRPVKGEGSYCQHHRAFVYKPIDEPKRLR